MEVISYQAFDEAAETTIRPGELSRQCLEALHGFVAFVADAKLLAQDALFRSLEQQFRLYAPEADPAEPFAGQELAGMRALLPQLDDVLRSYGAMVQGLMNLEASVWKTNEEISARKTTVTKLHYLTRYLFAKSLEARLGHDAALSAIKQYLDWRISQLPPVPSGPETIAAMCQGDIVWNRNDQGQDAVSALVSEDQCLKKVTACRSHHVLREYGDGQLMDAVACYPDFAAIRRTNPHFVLSRTQTLISGASYCDACFHDTRALPSFEHPALDVFDSLTGG